MAQDNVFGHLMVGQAPAAQTTAPAIPSHIPGRPKPAGRFENRDQELQEEANARAAAASARAAEADARARAEWNAAHNPDGTPKPKTTNVNPTQVPDGTAKRVESSVGTFTALQQAGSTFQDAFGGNPVGGLENLAQQYVDVGTPGQREWWSAFKATDNQIRNDLFGSALTATEKAAYEQTTIAPGMRPEIIRENVGRRKQIIQDALTRQRDFLIKNGYRPEAVDALFAPILQQQDALAGSLPQDDGRDADGFTAEERAAGLTGSVTDETPWEPQPAPPADNDPYSMNNIARGLSQGAGSVVEAAGDFAGIVANPVGTMIGRAAGYDGYTADLGTSLREALGLADNPNAISDTIIKGGTGALTGSLLARGASAITNPGAWQNALAQFGSTPGRDALAGAGAGLGGAVGQEIGGVPGQIAGTLAGGVGGYAGGNALARMASPRTSNSLMQSADDLGVTMMPADVGGVGTRMATGGIGRTLGGIPIAEGAERSIASASTARSKIAGRIGDVTDNVGAGQAAKRGFSQFEKNSRERADQLYESVSVPTESPVQLGQTRGALAEVTRGMQSNPELSRLWANHPRLRDTLEALTPKDVAADGRTAFSEASDRLTRLVDDYEAARNTVTDPKRLVGMRDQISKARQDMASAKELIDTPPQGGELSWQDMKRFRSIVGEVIGQPGIQRDGSDISALRKLYGAVTADMEVTAAQAGPRALQEFRRANQYWRGREGRIDDVFSALLGKDGGRGDEAVFKQINTWAKGDGGDFSRIARTIRSMPEDEANTIRATIIQRMGMAKPAHQDATEEVFSPSTFSTQWRGMSKRAKNVLFPNAQHRQDLEKLAELTDGMKQADQFQNYSNTALGVNLTAQGTLAAVNLPVAAALAGLQFGAGKLLSSPKFARIIASSSKLPPEQAGRRMTEQLKVLATREPIIANDVKSVMQYLQQTATQSPATRAAAREEEEPIRREPPRR